MERLKIIMLFHRLFLWSVLHLCTAMADNEAAQPDILSISNLVNCRAVYGPLFDTLALKCLPFTANEKQRERLEGLLEAIRRLHKREGVWRIPSKTELKRLSYEKLIIHFFPR